MCRPRANSKAVTRGGVRPYLRLRALVRAALRAAAERPAAPLVRWAFLAAAERDALLRLAAARLA